MIRFCLSRLQARNSILVMCNPPRCLKISNLSTSSNLPTERNSAQSKTTEKPDLRRAARNDRPRNIALVACLLVIVYMYPMIFRPLLGVGRSNDDDLKNLENVRKEIAKHRPDFMPEWSSPFGPRTKD